MAMVDLTVFLQVAMVDAAEVAAAEGKMATVDIRVMVMVDLDLVAMEDAVDLVVVEEMAIMEDPIMVDQAVIHPVVMEDAVDLDVAEGMEMVDIVDLIMVDQAVMEDALDLDAAVEAMAAMADRTIFHQATMGVDVVDLVVVAVVAAVATGDHLVAAAAAVAAETEVENLQLSNGPRDLLYLGGGGGAQTTKPLSSLTHSHITSCTYHILLLLSKMHESICITHLLLIAMFNFT